MADINIPNPKQPASVKTAVGFFDENNIFSQDIIKPEWDPILKELCKRYMVTDVLNKIGSGGTYTNDTIYWTEIGYWKKNQTIASATITTNTADIVLNETERFFIPSDVISLPSGLQVQVTAVPSTSPQTITVETLDGSTIENSDVTTNGTLYLSGSFVAKCSDAPAGRYFTPTKVSAIQTIQETTADYCVDETSDNVWIDGGYWYNKNQVLKRDEHNGLKQGNILWGNGNTTAITNGTSGVGLVPTVFAQGTVISDALAVTEDDIIDFAATMRYAGADYSYNEYWVLCGYKYMAAATKAMKQYVVNSNSESRYFKVDKEGSFGLELVQYKFNGAIYNFMACAAFDEPGVANLAGVPDTQTMALYINIGTNDRGRGIDLLYRKMYNGNVENNFVSKIDGIGSAKNGAVISQKKRCFTEILSSSYILKLTYRNSHGIHYLV